MSVQPLSSEKEQVVIELVADYASATMGTKDFIQLIRRVSDEADTSFAEVAKVIQSVFPEVAGAVENAVIWLNKFSDSSKESVDNIINLSKAYKTASKEASSLGVAVNSLHENLVAADADMARQAGVSLNQSVVKQMAERAILQGNLNKLDLEAIALQEKIALTMQERTVAENNVAVANEKIFASNLTEADAQMLALQEKLVVTMQQRTVAANNVALANQKIAMSESANNMLFAPAEIEKTNRALEQQPKSLAKASAGWLSFMHTVRSVLTGILVFEFLAKLVQTITGAIQSVKDLEIAFYNLGNAERAMSQAGTEVTLKELEDVTGRIGKKFKGMFSKTELTDATADIAIAVKDLGFGAKEIEKMLTAIAVVKLRTPAETMKDVTAHTVTALLSGRTQALQAMGIAANETTVKEKALEMGLITQGQALSTNVKALAILQIMYDSTKGEAEDLTKYTNTLSGANQRAKAAWTDLLTTLGQISAPNMIQSLNVISGWLISANTWLMNNAKSWGVWAGYVSGSLAAVAAGFDAMDKKKKLPEAMQAAANAFMHANLEAQQLAADFGKGQETPTSPKQAQEDNNAELQKALEKFNKEILDAQLKLKQDMEDAAIDLGRKLYDITVEYEQKRADAYREYQSKIKDIWDNYNSTIDSINRKQNEARAKFQADQIQKEKEFQNKMQELKEKFLMDLDDALHARDARQILRLIKQYNLEKLQAERAHALDKQAAKKEEELRQKAFAQERADAEKKRKLELAKAQQEYNDKITKLALDEALEVQAARLKYDRQLQDLQKANQDRLAIIAANLVEEFKLTQEGLQAIMNLYLQYYNNVSAIYSAMQSMMGAMQMIGGGVVTGGGTGTGGSGSQSGHPMAQGGTMIANRPTTVTFGEAGVPEMATFTPIGRTGNDVNKVFSSLSGAGADGGNGKVSIELLLSPDLESRIVTNTLNKTAEVITRTSRSRR